MEINKYIQELLNRTLENTISFEFELNKNGSYQKYLNINSFISDYNSGKLNINLPIFINDIKVIRIGRTHSGITLLFNPINDNDNDNFNELKSMVDILNSSLFSIKILNEKELIETLYNFSMEGFPQMEYNISNFNLTDQHKNEIELLIAKEGGPHSLIEYLLKGLNSFNRDYIISVLYYIPEIRLVNCKTLDELLFRYGIKINWNLIMNKKNIHYS